MEWGCGGEEWLRGLARIEVGAKLRRRDAGVATAMRMTTKVLSVGLGLNLTLGLAWIWLWVWLWVWTDTQVEWHECDGDEGDGPSPVVRRRPAGGPEPGRRKCSEEGMGWVLVAINERQRDTDNDREAAQTEAGRWFGERGRRRVQLARRGRIGEVEIADSDRS